MLTLTLDQVIWHTVVHQSTSIYTVPQKKTSQTCYNLYIHSSIATIFGKDVAEKVGNQNVLYFPASPN